MSSITDTTNMSISDTNDAPAEPLDYGESRGGKRQIDDLLTYTRRLLFISMLANLILGLGVTVFAAIDIVNFMHPPKPEYFATSHDGRITPLIPVTEPLVSQESLLSFAATAAIRAYTLNHVHYQQQLSKMRPDFTRLGFREHIKALEAAGTLEAIIERRLISSVVTHAPPIVTNQGKIDDRYVWKLEVPITIVYEGASRQSNPQKMVAELLIVRVPTNEVSRGIAIHQIITRTGS